MEKHISAVIVALILLSPLAALLAQKDTESADLSPDTQNYVLEPYNYYNSNGSTLVAAATEYINNEKYYIFTVNGSARKYMTPGGESMGTIPVGTKLAAKSSATGQTYGGYMVFYKKKSSNGSWQNLIVGETYGFVDLGLDVGSMPSDRPIR